MANRIGNSSMGDSADVNRSSDDRSDDSAIGREDSENIRGVGDTADADEEFDDEFEDTEDLDEDAEEENETI